MAEAIRNSARDAPLRTITGFHQDEQGDWVAELSCGHAQHVRHRPPWILTPWVVTEEGRRAHLGRELACKKCEDHPASS